MAITITEIVQNITVSEDGATITVSPTEQIITVSETTVTAATLGLGNVDNTSDLNKPISTATQTALDLHVHEGTEIDSTAIAAGEVLMADGAGNSVWGPVVLDGLQEVADDLTPQLGGPLDGNNQLINNVTSLQLAGGGGTEGTLSWNADEETVDLIQNGATLQIGQEIHIHVRNNTGVAIPDGTPVMAESTIGASGRITVVPMDGSDPANAKFYVGITTESIPIGEDGKVTTFGKVRGIDTTGTPYAETWADGDVIWISGTTAGDLTNVEPVSGMGLPIAFVIFSHGSTGTLMARTSNYDEHAGATAAQGALADTALQDITNEPLADLIDIPSITGNAGKLLRVNGTADGYIWGDPSGTTIGWGEITGTLSLQVDLQAELDAKSDTTHNHTGVYEPADATILKDIDIGVTVQAQGNYEPADATILKDADIGVTVQAQGNYEPADATILKDADIGITVQAYDATILTDSDIGVTVQAQGNYEPADATILKDADIGVTVQAYDATNLNEASSIKDLSDVLTTMTPNDGDAFIYNITNGWQAEPLVDNDTTDHLLLSNIGTNSHVQIDSHIGDGTLHYTQANISITESQISNLQSYLLLAQKGALNGVAELDGGGKVPPTQLPALALTEIFLVASEVEQLALTAQEGDFAIRSDISLTYAHNGGLSNTMADWSEILSPTDVVTSVDGRIGVVTLNDLYEPKDVNILKANDIGVAVQAYDANTALTSDITYETLDTNGDVGTLAGTLAIGDHNHSSVYEPIDPTILKDADIGVTVQAYDATILTGSSSIDDLSDVTITPPTEGDILRYEGGVLVNSHLASDLFPLMNGSIIDQTDLVLSDLGGNVLCEIFKVGGLTEFEVYIDNDHQAYNATSVILTIGTDTIPVRNWVYIEMDTGVATLKSSTVGFPTTNDYAPVADILLQSLLGFQTDGAYKVHKWTDHIHSDANGHISHLSAWIRNQHATWQDGVAPTVTLDEVPIPDTVFFSSSAGNVSQLHLHSYPAMDMATGTPLYVINDSTTPNLKVTDMAALLTDAEGVDTTGDIQNFIVWGIVSEDETDCKLAVNLANKAYPSAQAAAAILDADNSANYGIPESFKGTGFLIARVVLENTGGTVWEILHTEDLRGLLPNAAAGAGGGGGAVTDHSLLSNLLVDDHTQYALVDGTRAITNLNAPLTMNDQTGTAYTLTLADAGRNVTMTNAVANTITIPANASVAYPIGTQILISALGVGQTTVDITTDTLNVASLFTLKLAEQYSEALITKKTATMWVISGDLEAL